MLDYKDFLSQEIDNITKKHILCVIESGKYKGIYFEVFTVDTIVRFAKIFGNMSVYACNDSTYPIPDNAVLLADIVNGKPVEKTLFAIFFNRVIECQRINGT